MSNSVPDEGYDNCGYEFIDCSLWDNMANTLQTPDLEDMLGNFDEFKTSDKDMLVFAKEVMRIFEQQFYSREGKRKR